MTKGDWMAFVHETRCLGREKHTPCPPGFMQWHEWAEKKSKTHVQVKCDGCGLYVIWKPKRASARNPAQRLNQ
jgi:hypothetical protein